MKTSAYLFGAALALSLGACSSSESQEPATPQEAIGFSTHVWKNSRTLSNDNFKNFYVFGTYKLPTQTSPITVFNDVAVTKQADGTWTYSNERYWNPDGMYDFYAYSCENSRMVQGVSGSVDLDGTEIDLADFTISDGHYKHDLVFAKATGVTREHKEGVTPAPVAFEFRHILTRLMFTFKSDFPSGYKVNVSNLKITHFRDQGTFCGADGQWT